MKAARAAGRRAQSAMPLQPFSFPVPETRYLKAGSLIYKFKIRGGTSYSRDGVLEGECFNQELEDVVRTVLGNLDHLEPFSTAHYTVFPYKKRWGKAHKDGVKRLRLYPFVIVLYVEKNAHKEKQPEEEATQHVCVSDEPCSKRCRRDSPLEGAILKELIDSMEGERNKSASSDADSNHRAAEEEVNGDPALVDEVVLFPDPSVQLEDISTHPVLTLRHSVSISFSALLLTDTGDYGRRRRRRRTGRPRGRGFSSVWPETSSLSFSGATKANSEAKR
ncbi:membrane-anchored junction protein isoform X1 [Kryptolebias marmoratus]|uniref:membrane-anchored junction protein isoform X1 n=2 Tax=Kryptolebias marmoratus TaxID=37003 RepID=UPI000D52F313|nr:membrane-anchored junction protein isoform X1 [Kryptolebias marmoratus]XP_037832318.1 membrane-anchored junction protein isoform X1 [Kryptolebias marmoratus]